MQSIASWSMFAIAYQTALSLILSWFVLGCHLHPNQNELSEMTLMKLVYLYEPETCGHIHFYNFTTFMSNNRTDSFIVWLTDNPFAASVRRKTKLSLALHILWALTALAEVLHKRGGCSFYAFTLPFCLVGISILLSDVINAGFFIRDAMNFQSIFEIMDALGGNDSERIKFINVNPNAKGLDIPGPMRIFDEDTSWVGLVMAWFSVRGLVQWMVNYWIIVDTYSSGMKQYKIHSAAEKAKRKKSYYYSYY